MKDIYKELLDTKDIKGYTQEYLAWKKISLHIINRYPDISMMLSCQRYPFISLKLILVLLRIKGYLGISWDKWGYLRISFWGELPDECMYWGPDEGAHGLIFPIFSTIFSSLPLFSRTCTRIFFVLSGPNYIVLRSEDLSYPLAYLN